jgi:hypothetical protein
MSNASAGDKYIFDEVIEAEIIEKPWISKEMQIIYDSNNGTYNNQILFSTGMMNSTGKYVDFQNSYIEIPFVMAISSDQDITAAGATNPFQMGLKDSSLQLVDSLILQYNGTSVIQNSIFTNVMQHFKVLASWTQEDLTKWGPATITAPDNTTSFRFTNAAASPFGDGISNNSISPVVPTLANWTTENFSYNDGYLKRLQMTGLSPNGPVSGVRTDTVASSQFNAKPYWTNNAGVTAARIYYWQVVLTLRCKDLSDFFNKIPIMKAGRIDMTINFNTYVGTITNVLGVAATTNGTLVTLSGNQTAGHSCPFMVSAASVSGVAGSTVITQPTASLASGVLTVGCGINGVNGIAKLAGLAGSGPFANCRWYVPTYEPNPEFEQALLSESPVKTIYYDDFYTYTSIINASGTFSNLISSGVKNPQYVILFPFLNGAVANSGNVGSYASYQSFFNSAPGTTDPCSLTNFQIQCGGKTMFPLIEQYGYQQYFDEFSSIFALNGGKADIVTSGLVSKSQWEAAPVYLCNLSRRLPQEDGTAKSVQISATINSVSPVNAANPAKLDIIVFVVYQRKAEFNLLNGLLVSNDL